MAAGTDAGLIGVARGFELKRYTVILVDRFTVPASLVKDQDDQKLAALFPVALQSELVTRLRATGLFDRVVNLSETQFSPGDQPALRLDPGSRALRYMVGFGAGAAKAQAEIRLIDLQTGAVMVVTADRREAYFGIFGGDSEAHMPEALSDMARDSARLMVRLKTAPIVAAAPATSAMSSETSALVGMWRGTLLISERRIGGPSRENAATLQIFEDDGGLRWTLVSAVDGKAINGSGTASVAGDQVKFTLKRAGR